MCLKSMANFKDFYQYSFGVTSVTAAEVCCLQMQPFPAHTTGTLQIKCIVFSVIYLDLNFCVINCHKLIYHNVCQSDLEGGRGGMGVFVCVELFSPL